MPTYSGGDIQEVVCKHTLGTFRFQHKSNEDVTINPGGFRSNDDDDSITGAGEMIDQINRKRPSFEFPSLAVDFVSENETKNLPLLAGSSELGVWTVTIAGGIIWKMKGKPVGDLNFTTNNPVMAVKIAGSGIAEKL